MVDSDQDPALAPLNSALKHAFAQAQELGIDTSPLLARLEEQGPDDFVADALPIPWTEYFNALVKFNRLDLTIEATISAPRDFRPLLAALLRASYRVGNEAASSR